MTIASICVAAIVVYLFITNPKAETLLLKVFTVNLLYEGFINLGSFATIGGLVLKVADVLQIICVLLSVIIMIRRGVNPGLVAFVTAVVMSVVMLVVNPLNEMVRTFDSLDIVGDSKIMHYPSLDAQGIKTTFRLLAFALNATVISLCMTKEKWKEILDKYLQVGRIVIIYAWLEFVIKNILNLSILETVLSSIFGADLSVMTGLERNGLFVITGFNNEPSQFCMMLYSYFLVYLMSASYKRQTTWQRRITLSGLALMFLCGSFRLVGMLPVMLIIYMIVTENRTKAIGLTSAAAGLLVMLYFTGALDYYFGRLDNAMLFVETLDSSMVGGEAGRLNTIVEAFGVFLKRPILGIGPGQTFAYGFIPSMLAMTGLTGLVSWYGYMFFSIGGIRKTKNSAKWIWILVAVSVSWIYTDSIAIGYSIYVLAMAFSIRYHDALQESLRENRGEIAEESALWKF